jgi:hypothetical protein
MTISLECTRRSGVLAKFLVLTSFFASLTGCQQFFCDRYEVSREISKNGDVEIFVSSINCGATTSLVYSVSLAQAGKPSTKLEIFRASAVDRLSVDWASGRHVSIIYGEARIHSFRNYWVYTDDSGVVHEVLVTEAGIPMGNK